MLGDDVIPPYFASILVRWTSSIYILSFGVSLEIPSMCLYLGLVVWSCSAAVVNWHLATDDSVFCVY